MYRRVSFPGPGDPFPRCCRPGAQAHDLSRRRDEQADGGGEHAEDEPVDEFGSEGGARTWLNDFGALRPDERWWRGSDSGHSVNFPAPQKPHTPSLVRHPTSRTSMPWSPAQPLRFDPAAARPSTGSSPFRGESAESTTTAFGGKACKHWPDSTNGTYAIRPTATPTHSPTSRKPSSCSRTQPTPTPLPAPAPPAFP